ncbi:MAG: transposase [Gemmatimonadetes bacterium]|nr:transposase [Gemmatimonadota bacterium]
MTRSTRAAINRSAAPPARDTWILLRRTSSGPWTTGISTATWLGSSTTTTLSYHFHLCVVDGLFERIDSDQGPETNTGGLRFHEAAGLTPQLLDRLQHTVRQRVLYVLPSPDPSGRTALRLSALEFLDRLATLVPPPHIHRHRYHGVFAPNAPLRPLIAPLELSTACEESP